MSGGRPHALSDIVYVVSVVTASIFEANITSVNSLDFTTIPEWSIVSFSSKITLGMKWEPKFGFSTFSPIPLMSPKATVFLRALKNI